MNYYKKYHKWLSEGKLRYTERQMVNGMVWGICYGTFMTYIVMRILIQIGVL